jgi:aspartyl-tRNA(Asn)/glutamyl-tRNA(Gln) amidotransferase subunit A
MYSGNYSLILETICDNEDSTSSERPVLKFSYLINGDIKGKRIGIPKEYRMEGNSEEFIHHWEKCFFRFKEQCC